MSDSSPVLKSEGTQGFIQNTSAPFDGTDVWPPPFDISGHAGSEGSDSNTTLAPAESELTAVPPSKLKKKKGETGPLNTRDNMEGSQSSEGFSFSDLAKYRYQGTGSAFQSGGELNSQTKLNVKGPRSGSSSPANQSQSHSGRLARVKNLFALTRKNDTRARKASGVADFLLQQQLGIFEVAGSAASSRRNSRSQMPHLDMIPGVPQQNAMDDPLTLDTLRSVPTTSEGLQSLLPSERLPRPSIMDLAFCDLQKIQVSFQEHTSVWNQVELLDRFKRLVIRAIKEEEEHVIAEEEANIALAIQSGNANAASAMRAERDPVYETALSTGFLNGPDIIPVGVPARFLQKARAQLMWEYERRVAGRMEDLQLTKYQNWRYSQQQDEFMRSARFGNRINPLGVTTKDGYLSHAMPRMQRSPSLPSPESKKGKKAVPRGGDTMPVPVYLTRTINENRAALSSESFNSPPSYRFPWEVDVYDNLGLTLAGERRLKDSQDYSLDAKKDDGGAGGTRGRPGDSDSDHGGGEDTALQLPLSAEEQKKAAFNRSKKGMNEIKQDIPLPTFVYVVSRILFRMYYADVFPTGLFNRELIDPYYFPEPEELDTPYFYRYFPRLAESADKIYSDRLERLQDQFVTTSPPIEANDFISVHQLLCPIKKKDSAFNDVALPWLHLTEVEEDNLLPKDFTESMSVDRRRYREMLQSCSQRASICAELSRMMTICRLVAFEFFEGIDSTQRGVITWGEFTDALIEHAEVTHHREKAEESMKTMRTCASVFDHYRVESLPSVLLHLGYSGFTVEVRYSGSLIILKGPYDFAVCNGASGGSVEFKFVVRATKDILDDYAKAMVLAARAAANGDTAGIEFHDAEASDRPWRNNTKVPGVFIRYIDGKRLDEVAAMSIAEQIQKDKREEQQRQQEELERRERAERGSTSGLDDGEGGLDSDQGSTAPVAAPTQDGAEGGGEEAKKASSEPPKTKHSTQKEGVSVRKKDDIEVRQALQLNDIIFGLPPILLTLCSDLIFRVYVMVPMLVALPETAILRTYETTTCMDWCGASGAIHEELRHYLLCGTRGGHIQLINIRAALKKMPRLNEARHGVIGSVFSSNAGYADLAGITHQDDIYHYLAFDKAVHKSIVCSVSVSDCGVIVSSSLDGEVFMGRLHYTVSALEVMPIRRFHACDSGVRCALYANIAQVIVVQTVASKIFVYGVANQKVHVELYDPQAPHFFPIISMIVVDDLDQLITADTSGFVKVWSLRRCTPMSAFYALSKAGKVNLAEGGGESGRLFDVDQQGGGSVALTGGGNSGEGKKGLLDSNRRTIEKAIDTGLALAPLRNLAYDHVTHRLFATGLRNSVMCTFVFGQGGARAHMERICFIGISFRSQWILTMSCSDCRLWALSTGSMTLGIRANNAEYNLLDSERMSHLDKNNGQSQGAGLMSNLNDFLDDTHHSLEVIKRMPRSADDVIRTVAATKVHVNAYKRVPLHIPKSEVPHVRLEMQMSRFSENPLEGITGRHAINGNGGRDMSNQNDNTRNTNVKHGDILCAVIGQHDRLLIYALSTGDLRVHRCDSGRLVKTYVTLAPTTEEVLSAALFYRHLYISSNSRGKGDEGYGGIESGVHGNNSSVVTPNSILNSLTSQQRVEAVAALLQRMLTDSKDAVMMGSAARGSFHMEPVNMICLDSSQELVVMYADGVIRYFPLIGTMLTSHKLIIPEFLVVKAVHFFNSPPPTRRRIGNLLPATSTTSSQPSAAFPHQSGSDLPFLNNEDDEETSDSDDEDPVMVRTTGNSGRSSLKPKDKRNPSKSQIHMRLPRNLTRSQSAAKESLEALNHAMVEADAVSLVAVSTYLQLICIVQVTGVVSVIDISGGGTNVSAVATADSVSVPVGANVIHSFVTKEEVTAITFLGAYPCLLIADRFAELHFYLLKGSSTLSLVEDFFKAIVMDRHARYARSMKESMNLSMRDKMATSATSRNPPHFGPGGPKIDVPPPPSSSSDKRNAALPRVWSVRMPPEIGTPISIHFDPRYSVVYVGTKEGFISSFNVQKFILAVDLSPLCISAAEVSLDAYLMALKQQQQESNEEVIRNFLLIVFGLSPSDVNQYLLSLHQEKVREFTRIREILKNNSNAHAQLTLPAIPDAEPPKWENSLQWVYENCEPLLRGVHKFFSDDFERERLPPLIDLDDVTLTDMLLATTIMHDATRLISLRQKLKSKGKSSLTSCSSNNPANQLKSSKGTIDPKDPAVIFLRSRDNTNQDDVAEEESAGCKMIMLKRSDIHQIRKWIKQALNNKAQPPLVDPTKPWNCGWRTYRRGSSFIQRPGSAKRGAGGPGDMRSSFSSFDNGSMRFSENDEEDHLIVSRWVEPLFQRHAMFMSDNCPLTLLSPYGTLERARREKQEREKAMIQSTQIQPVTLEEAAAAAETDNSPQSLRKGNWDEFVEGIIPRVQPTSSKQGGIMQEMDRLLASDMGVIRILTRRNGYVLVGLEDGSISLWTPYACARIAQVCSSITLPSAIIHLGEAIKNQFTQLFEILTLQRQRVAFEADGVLGRNATEGESKIKAKIKSMIVNHQLQKMKKQTAKEEAARAEAEADGSTPPPEKKDQLAHTLRHTDGGPPMHPATKMMEQHLEDVKDIIQLYCGYQRKEDFSGKNLYIEDLFYLPMRMSDLMEIESLEPSWYNNAVDLSIDRLLFDICSVEGSATSMNRDYNRRSIYHGLPGMSTASLIARGDLRLVTCMLNFVLEIDKKTHEVDFINFAHDYLLSQTSKEEENELTELRRLNRKIEDSKMQERQGGATSWADRLRGNNATGLNTPLLQSGSGASYIHTIMDNIPGAASQLSFDGPPGESDLQAPTIEDNVRVKALQLRVGAAAQLSDEPPPNVTVKEGGPGSVHPSRRRSLIRRSLVVMDSADGIGSTPKTGGSAYGEGSLMKMAVERCMQQAPNANPNDISSKLALEKKIAALGPNRPQVSAAYERAFAGRKNSSDTGGEPGSQVSGGSSSNSDDEEKEMLSSVNPARAEAWLYSSTYSHNQPLLVVSNDDDVMARTESLSIMDAGKTQALNFNSSGSDLGFRSPPAPAALDVIGVVDNAGGEDDPTSRVQNNSPAAAPTTVEASPLLPISTTAGDDDALSLHLKDVVKTETIEGETGNVSSAGSVAFVAPFFLTETQNLLSTPASPSATNHRNSVTKVGTSSNNTNPSRPNRSFPAKATPNAKNASIFSTNAANSASPSSAHHQTFPGLSRPKNASANSSHYHNESTNSPAQSHQRLPYMRWQLSQKKRKAKLGRTGVQIPRTKRFMLQSPPPPLSNTFVPSFAQTNTHQNSPFTPDTEIPRPRPHTSTYAELSGSGHHTPQRTVSTAMGTSKAGRLGRLGAINTTTTTTSGGVTGLDRGSPPRARPNKTKSMADLLIEAAEERLAQQEEGNTLSNNANDPITDIRSFLTRGHITHQYGGHTTVSQPHANPSSFLRKKYVSEVLPGPQHS